MSTIKIHTLLEVRQELGVSRSTVYRLVRAGDLDVLRIGSSVRVTRKSIDAFLSRQLQFAHAGLAR